MSSGTGPEASPEQADDIGGRLLSAGASMAVGTLLSRLTGFLRGVLILAAIGKSLDAELFQQANTVPNSLYILIAGGVFNVVLVPQLVRAMKRDPDGGEAYANRVLTLGLVLLAVATVALMVAVPLLVRLAFPGSLYDPGFERALDSAYHLMWFCLPQVFFYGVFVLIGQILNSREKFGPMMWAPIVNNVVASSVLAVYIWAYGTSDAAGGFSLDEELLLGLGSTAGIALQTVVLLPYLRAIGFRVRPRFDFRGVGLGHTARLGLWTLLFVVVNQIAYFIVSRIGVSSATRAVEGAGEASGNVVYQNAFLVTQVPHGVITVSLVTATMPLISRLAADHDLPRMRTEVVATLRLVLAVIVPMAGALAALAMPLTTAMFSYGAAEGKTEVIGYTLLAFTPGMVLFTVHYLMLRGFYADEDTRTPFFVQIGVSVTNIALAIGFATQGTPDQVSTRLALAYGAAYLVGSAASVTALSRRIGPIISWSLARYLGRLLACTLTAVAVMLAAQRLVTAVAGSGRLEAGATLLLAGTLGAVTYLGAARLMHVDEVNRLRRVLLRRGTS